MIRMSKKVRLTRKDSYLIILGVLIAFMIQSVYDAFREEMNMVKLNM
jgi:hypothetical protein